jgi:hypothetical protein
MKKVVPLLTKSNSPHRRRSGMEASRPSRFSCPAPGQSVTHALVPFIPPKWPSFSARSTATFRDHRTESSLRERQTRPSRPLSQFAGNGLYRTFPPLSKEFLSILWPRPLRDVHHDNCEFWKLLQRLGSGFAKPLDRLFHPRCPGVYVTLTRSRLRRKQDAHPCWRQAAT